MACQARYPCESVSNANKAAAKINNLLLSVVRVVQNLSIRTSYQVSSRRQGGPTWSCEGCTSPEDLLLKGGFDNKCAGQHVVDARVLQ